MNIKNFIGMLTLSCMVGCSTDSCVSKPPRSASGVSKADVKVPVGSDGLTVEQRNVKDRLLKDNEPGSIKHLYVISAYSGQVLIYSTVKGKVTSSGKRLTPVTVNNVVNDDHCLGFEVNLDGQLVCTQEVLQDDGTYGSSAEYLYWFDVNGVYHQHYVQGGQIVHISSQPLAVKSVVINMEVSGKSGDVLDKEDPLPSPSALPAKK